RGRAGPFRLENYRPEPSLAGRTLEQIAASWRMTPVEAYMRIVKATEAEGGSDQEMENVLVTAMSEDDLRWFIAHPDIMFSSDGELHGSHPRGAGAFPRVLGHYVRDEREVTVANEIPTTPHTP